MAWLYLTAAILSEVAGTVALRSTGGFTNPVPSAIVVLGYGASFVLLSLVLKDIPLGVTYAIWAGTGTALIAMIDIVALGEPATAIKLASLVLIVGGVIGLNLGGAH